MENAYWAGLFDGEGCIRINRWAKPGSTHVRYNLFCTLGITHRPTVELMAKQFDGHLSMNRHDLRNSNCRIQFLCTLASQKAAKFLREIRPFTSIKSDEIDVALKLQDHIDRTPYVRTGRRGIPRDGYEAIREYRESLYREIRDLKKRSFPPLLSNGPIEPSEAS